MDSNFIPRNSKKFEYSNFDSTIRIYIENKPETRKYEVLWLSNSLAFSIESFETLTRFCGNTAFCISNLTGPSERGPRDLWGSVLWRYTSMVILKVFRILLNRSNRRLSKFRNHKLSWKKFFILSKFLTGGLKWN